MAANPVGRWCSCGCGQSIDHLSNQARYLPEFRKPKPRFCACQCGASIDHLHQNAKYLPDCLMVKQKMRIRTRVDRPRATVTKVCIIEGCSNMVLHARRDSVRCTGCQLIHERGQKVSKQRRVYAHPKPGPKLAGEPEYVPTIHCKECCGLPHRRPHKWRCPVCREEWQEEPRPEQVMLRSSAGTTSDAGK